MKKLEHVGALVQERTLVRSKEFKGLSVSRSHLWNLAKAGKIERVDRFRMRAAQKPQGVVLLRREAEPTEEFVLQGAQAIIGAPEVEEHLLL